jgi:aspartyl-tRNA(Asn)/glutamyl-tRNA(Gln) amidotransferase subunit C
MSETLSDEQVRHVARLSRLKLDPAQVDYFRGQLSSIVQYVGQLSQLDVDEVLPMPHPTDMINKLREDLPGATLDIEQVLANAPQQDPPFFRVPKILGDAGGA